MVTTALSDQRVHEYEERGYLDVESLLTTEQLAELRQRTEDIVEGRVPDFPDEKLEFEPGANGVRTMLTVRKMNHCAESDPVLMRHAKNEKILDIVECLLGPDIKLYSSQAFMKPPGGVEKPYHQDSPYFTIEPMSLTTCWIALDDVTLENGCLWVVPGSHRLGPLPHSEKWEIGDRVDMRIPETAFDRNLEVPITLRAGSCSFHHSLLLHMSHPNQTPHPRRGLAFHYMTAKSRWTNETQPVPNYVLLRGQSYPECV
jgi:phytanoyl-CoA hydroxylase